MTRFILNKPTGVLNFVDLGHVKKIIRERVVVGLLDENMFEVWIGSLITLDGLEVTCALKNMPIGFR